MAQAHGVMTVQFEQLSNHPGEQLRYTRAQLDDARRNTQLWVGYGAQADADHDAARRTRSRWKRVFDVTTPEMREAEGRRGNAQHSVRQAEAHRQKLEENVSELVAGISGEQLLVAWLDPRLSDEWLGFGGYQNKRGEADLVLVGPSGVWVVEVKNRNVELFADGDHWHFRKFDVHGNVVKEQQAATDRTGRSWGRQASDVADRLRWWLNENELQVPIRTVVLLINGRASIGRSANPGVDLLTARTGDLLADITSQPQTLDRHVHAQVARMIEKDHRHTERKMQERRAR